MRDWQPDESLGLDKQNESACTFSDDQVQTFDLYFEWDSQTPLCLWLQVEKVRWLLGEAGRQNESVCTFSVMAIKCQLET